jgi:flagellar hook-basal body complex protein FliE
MSISSIQNSVVFSTLTNAAKSGNSIGSETDFLTSFTDALQKTTEAQTSAEQQVKDMLNGNGQDVHSSMLAVEHASLSFELMLQVRNKVVNAYQEISRLQF